MLARTLAPGLVQGSWRAQLVTVLQRDWSLCPVSGPGNLSLGCWSCGGSWEFQEHYFLCSKGSSREKRRLKVQIQPGQQAEQGMSAKDCWQRFLCGWRERQEDCKQLSCVSCRPASGPGYRVWARKEMDGKPPPGQPLPGTCACSSGQLSFHPARLTLPRPHGVNCHPGAQGQSTRYMICGSQSCRMRSAL